LAYITGTVDQELLLRNEYLVTENRILRNQITSRVRLTRGHWQIENQSHWVRDVTFDEDRSQVRCGSIPQVLAALRNTVRLLLDSRVVDLTMS